MPVEEIFSSAITMKPGDMTSTLMQGSAVTLIGVAILLTTHVTLVDITGGILTGIGVLISAGVVTIKRGKVLRELNGGLKAGRKQLEDRLTQTPFGKIQPRSGRNQKLPDALFRGYCPAGKAGGGTVVRGKRHPGTCEAVIQRS